jgi:hypothetical protein
MIQRIGFGLVVVGLLVLGPACQKNGETEMRPASGTNPDYQRGTQENPGFAAPPLEPPAPGSGSGVPGTETTPGAVAPGESELDPSQHPPPRYPTGVNPESASDAATATWGAEPAAGGHGGHGGSGAPSAGRGGRAGK